MTEKERASQSAEGVGSHGPKDCSALLLRSWQILTVALAVAVLALGVACYEHVYRFGAAGAIDALGYHSDPSHFGTIAAHKIVSIDTSSPLIAHQVDVGDLLLRPPRGSVRPGDTLRLQVVHHGTVRNITVRVNPVETLSGLIEGVLNYFLGLVMLVLGVVIALRRRRDVAALALACALLIGAGAMLDKGVPSGLVAELSSLWNLTDPILISAALTYTALTFEGGYYSRATPVILRVLIVLTGVSSAWVIGVFAPYVLGRALLAADWLIVPARSGLISAAIVLCAVAFVNAWRHITGEPRQRFRWLLAAVLIALFSLSLDVASSLKFIPPTETSAVLLGVILTALYTLAVLILTYAVLRHRVIDVGFVISRTLVFAIFTALLLVLFGVIEWLLDHFIHIRQREDNVLVDGAIAVALYLVFHRVRHGIEHAVERVFFRASHDRLAALKQFMETVPHFSEPDALADALLKALDRYVDSQGSAIYRRDHLSGFVLDRATLSTFPHQLGADMDVVVELRTPRKAHHFLHLEVFSWALTVPVIRRSELVGFLAMSERRDRTLYRPDEIENIVLAVHQVSSDLYALQLERVEQEKQELEKEVSFLRARTLLGN